MKFEATSNPIQLKFIGTSEKVDLNNAKWGALAQTGGSRGLHPALATAKGAALAST